MKYAVKHKTPRQEGESYRGVGRSQGLVEADAGYVGGVDGGGVVEFVLGEGEGEVLDAVGRAEFSEEHDEFAEFVGEPVCVVGRSDCHEQHQVDGEIVESIRLCEDYERQGECCVFRDKGGAVGVVLIAELYSRSAIVVGEIFLDVGECRAEARVAYDRKVGRWLRIWRHGCRRSSLVAENCFLHGREVG